MTSTLRYIKFLSNSAIATDGRLLVAGRRLDCRLGRTGIKALKREGDGATPLGRLRLLDVRYRADRVARPQTLLPVQAIGPSDGWCDDPLDRNYNRPVPLPYGGSAERLWREDHLYDLLVVLDYNLSRRAKGKGSAIFLHLANSDGKPTDGCLAMAEHDLRRLLTLAERRAFIDIGG